MLHMNLKMNSSLKADHLDWEQIRITTGADLEGIGSRLEDDMSGKENEVVQLVIRRSSEVCFKYFKGL